MQVNVETRPERILCIDVENGPKWGWGPKGYTYSAVFCIGWKWVGARDSSTKVVLIDWRKSNSEIRETLAPVYKAIASATHFLGHNFDHDKRLLMGTAKDFGIPLPNLEKPVIDTMRSVPASEGAMRSLESLCVQFDLGEKPHVPDYVWVEAWIRWKTGALFRVMERCQKDVVLTERLYVKEMELEWLPRQL